MTEKEPYTLESNPALTLELGRMSLLELQTEQDKLMQTAERQKAVMLALGRDIEVIGAAWTKRYLELGDE
jgi:hypothetical protein